MALTVVRGVSASNGRHPAMPGDRRPAANATKRLATIWEDVSEWDDVLCRAAKSSRQSAPLTWPLGLEQPLQLADHAAAESFLKCLKSSCQSNISDVHAWLRGSSVALALTEHGARALIAIINVGTGADRVHVASDLKGHIVALCMSPHGHKVLLHLIENMTANAIPFIAEEIFGQSAQVAKDKFGYQVVESMIMHYPQSCIASISKEIAHTTEELCRHPVGHVILQRVIEYGPQSSQTLVLQRLTNSLPLLMMNYAASRVVEKAIECLGTASHRTIAHALLQPCRQACLADVACSRCGSSLLIQLSTANVCTDELRPQLLCSGSRLGKSKYGVKVLSAFGMTAEGKHVHK